ncbi:MAG: VWA domain-containing protein [Candidatus Aminicenantaceae bacterium]
MKKTLILVILVSILLFLTSNPAFHQERHEVVVTNVQVPLRVFEGERFVPDLTMADFEVYEDGKPQDVTALYLTRNGEIERMDATRDYMPMVGRQFYFFFQVLNYNPKMTEAIEYFFNHVYQPGDDLVIQTPIKNYNLPAERARTIPKETLVKDMQTIIRKDAGIGAMEYKNLLKELRRIIRSISAAQGGASGMADMDSSDSVGIQSLEFLLPRYRDTLGRMEELRLIDEKWILRFASQMKRIEEQKTVYFFYEREFRPEIQASLLGQIQMQYHDDYNIIGQIQDLFQAYHRELTLDVDQLSRAFSDAAVLFNFFFMDKKPENVSGVYMREQSEDVYMVFSQVAEATGGVVDSSQNPAAAFKSTSILTEYSYLLYYSPREYVRDGNFKTIDIKIKDKDYRITHRKGYYAH